MNSQNARAEMATAVEQPMEIIFPQVTRVVWC